MEVVSDPGNRCEIERLENKRRKYLDLGATVWEVWANQRETHIYQPGEQEPVIERETLRFEGLPGLEIPLAMVFAKLSDDENHNG